MMVKLKKMLEGLARVVAEEADRNPEFRKRLLGTLEQEDKALASPQNKERGEPTSAGRPKNRRAAAVFDPVEIAALGEETLRTRLASLTLEQLLDIVSDYGMDPGRIVVKWKSEERVMSRIIEMAIARAQKGNAFRPDQA